MRALLACVFKSQWVGEPPILIRRGTHVFTAQHRFLVSARLSTFAWPVERVYYLATCLLTQYDSFSEKLTFIQNSLLLLYIAKKIENWKTVTLFFGVIFWQSLFFLQPGRKNHPSTFPSSSWCCCPFCSITPGSWLFFFIFWPLRLYI